VAKTRDRTQPIHAVTKQEIESYLAQYSAQNFINHRAALSNLFGYAFKNRSDAGEPTFDHRETSDQASQARDLE